MKKLTNQDTECKAMFCNSSQYPNIWFLLSVSVDCDFSAAPTQYQYQVFLPALPQDAISGVFPSMVKVVIYYFINGTAGVLLSGHYVTLDRL
ncbi:hypothetical protein BgiMline_032274 [Biomphalaria glabrata]